MQTAVHAASRSRFFVRMSGFALLIAITGFLPTYWLPLLTGKAFPPILHIHGAIFVSWFALLFWQSLLVANGRTADHRSWGMAGIALATAMVISVLLAVLNGFAAARQIGMEPQARVFSAVSLSGITVFAVLFLLAIRNVRNPDVHRRLIYATSVPLLEAAVARWFMVATAPPEAVGPPPLMAAIPPGLLVFVLFLVPLVVHDRRTIGHLHPASLKAMAAVLFVVLLPLVLGPSALWAGFSGAFAELLPGH